MKVNAAKIDGNLVRRQRRRRQAAGECGCGGEHADFERNLACRRKPERQQPPHPCEFDAQEASRTGPAGALARAQTITASRTAAMPTRAIDRRPRRST